MTFAPGSVTVNVDGSYAGSGLALALFEAEVASIGQVAAALMSVGAAPFTPPAPSAGDKALIASKANLAAQRMAIVLDQRISVAVADAIAGLGGGSGFTIAGAGLVSSGGGATVDVGAGTGISVNANDVAVDTSVIATRVYADAAAAAVVPFTTEAAQDAIGALLVDSATIDVTYNDAGNAETIDVIDGSITSAKLDATALAQMHAISWGLHL